jgi:hypothetical protein
MQDGSVRRCTATWRTAGLWLIAGAALSGCAESNGESESTAALLERYCVECHNAAEFAGNLVLTPDAVHEVGTDAQTWEKVVRKLGSRSMPPADSPHPAPEAYVAAGNYLVGELDRHARTSPQPGALPLFRRLTRTEYANAIRDLLAIAQMPSELNYELLLPADNASSGFDNIADLLFVSPVVMERYIAAAQKIARLAVGDMRAPEMVNIHMLSEQLPQDARVDALPIGTRGGLAVQTYLPLDADYVVRADIERPARDAHQIELIVDGERAALQTIGGAPIERDPFSSSNDGIEFRVPIAAGPHLIGITFLQRSEAFDEALRRPRMRGRGSDPSIAMATISGPYDATGPGSTPSRARIFSCEPQTASDELSCAREILSGLARRAYRRAIDAQDIDDLMPFYEAGRAEGSFETGIQFALERLLVSPQFLYRIEREPDASAEVAEVSDVDLASRISFFVWSSIPDDELLELAIEGRLREPGVLDRQITRMLADPRASAMVTNFAAQWLFLRDVASKDPDIFLFPDYDESLRTAFVRETELFVESVFRGDRSVLDLLTADYTFANERLAKHYEIPNVQGSFFRRIDFEDDSPRGGLLSHGSILTVTSYSTRTSPVLRGKYVLENLLASPPPPPPPDVPALDTEAQDSGQTPTMREAMTRHRADPACASCHIQMDAVGFALENFDAVGRWRAADDGRTIEAYSELPDGSVIDGVDGVRQMLTADPERFVAALTEKLLMYALGRNVQYYDAPAVRAIVQDAAAHDYRFSAIVRGIVESVPFQMRAGRTS